MLGEKSRDKRGEHYTNGDECWNNNERIFFQIKTVVIGQLVYIYLYASRTVMTRTIHVLAKKQTRKRIFFLLTNAELTGFENCNLNSGSAL